MAEARPWSELGPLEAEAKSYFLSWCTWSYLNSFFVKGYRRPLEQPDLGCVLPRDSAHTLADRFHAKLEPETAETQHNGAVFAGVPPEVMRSRMWRGLATWEWPSVAVAGVCKLLGDLLGFVGPLALSGIVRFVALKAAGRQDERWGGMELGYWWLIACFVSAILQNWLLQNHHQLVIRAGARIKTATGTLVYRKSLRIDAGKRAEFGNGKIQNLQTGDANAVNMMYWFIHYSWAAPLQLAICMAMLYEQLGPSAFVGLGVTIALFPLQGWMGSAMAGGLKAAMTQSDARVKLVNEAVSGIRIIKYFALEENFHARIADVRGKELKQKWKVALINAINVTLNNVGPLLVALLSFLTYGFVEPTPLTASKAFTSMTLFTILRLPLMVLPMLVGAVAAAKVSVHRFADFFCQPDHVDHRTFIVDPSAHVPSRPRGMSSAALNSALAAGADQSTPEHTVVDAEVNIDVGAAHSLQDASSPTRHIAVEFADTTLRWPEVRKPGDADTSATAFHLREVALRFPRGKLTSIVGAVGSGKSSLLAAILGDMELVDGAIRVYGPAELLDGLVGTRTGALIAYCSQQPWIQNATLRENIVFGLPFDSERYEATIEACALRPDLAVLPAGDGTEIGERGVNLSGGQKARVALARAVYSACPIVVLDDVLSAVDAHVARHIFNHALRGVLAGRTIIMATHQLQFVARSDMIVVMSGGQVTQVGAFDALLADSTAESNLLRDMMAERQRIDDGLAASAAASESNVDLAAVAASQGAPQDAASSGDPEPDAATPASPDVTRQASVKKVTPADAPAATKDTKADKGKLMTEEDRNRGSVPSTVYGDYLLAMGRVTMPLMVVTLALSNAGIVGTDWWLSYWADDKAGGRPVGYYIGVYAGITVATGLVTFLFMLSWAFGSLNASSTLHDVMLLRVLRSPMSFFDSTPVGRILNRFSTDIQTIDGQLPTAFSSFISLLVRCLATFIVQAIIFPWILLALGPLVILYGLIQRFYRATMREIKRLESVTRSPVYAHLGETLNGLPTLRAYGVFPRFERVCEERMDSNQVAFVTLNLLNRWLGLRLDWLGSVMVGATALVSVLTAGSVDPGLVGLALSYSMSVTSLLNWLVRGATETETYLACVERVEHYMHLPVERPPVIAETRPDAAWPAKGEVVFDNLTVRYRPDLDPVLRNISVRIAAGEKIGVCGRTGAGKSSMMLALYRILEAESGSISIDGVNIANIGLDDLRKRLAIIPQDPTLFSGTIRYNMDVEGARSDAEIWAALERVQMKDKIKAKELGLAAPVTEGGENFSVGERQLLCTARALLRGARVVVLDEATASTDVISDSIIQTMLRTEFPGVTMLIIAHRVNTILDADKILLLDQGRVSEFAPPSELLQDPSSRFAGLVRESATAGH